MNLHRYRYIVALVLGGVLVGCSPDGGSAVRAPTEAERQQWALPLDEYMLSDAAVGLTDYAENLLVSECMTAAQFDWVTPRVQVDALSQPTRSPSGRRVFTVEIAQTFGYHEPSILPAEVRDAMDALDRRSLSATEGAALETCIQQARVTLPRPEYSQLGTRLANQALAQSIEDSAVKDAGKLWRECMLPQGVSDLPEMPDGSAENTMPPPSLVAQFGVDVMDSLIGAPEIEMAVADAQCRETSGFSDALYLVEWERQSEALAENAEDLVRERDAIKEHLAAAQEIITDRGAS